jgi:hypothetical protein
MSRRRYRRNPHIDKRLLWIGGITAAAAAAGYAAWKFTAPAAVTAGSVNVLLSPGNVNLPMAVGQVANVALPSGASWDSSQDVNSTRKDVLSAGAPTSGNMPFTFTLKIKPTRLSLFYVDSSGAKQTSTLMVS